MRSAVLICVVFLTFGSFVYASNVVEEKPLHIIFAVAMGTRTHVNLPALFLNKLVAKGHRISLATFDEQLKFADGTRLSKISLGPSPMKFDIIQWSRSMANLTALDITLKQIREVNVAMYEPMLISLNRTIHEQKPDLLLCDFFAEACADLARLYNIRHAFAWPSEYGGLYDSPFNDMAMIDIPAPRTFLQRLHKVFAVPAAMIPLFGPVTASINAVRTKYGLPTLMASYELAERRMIFAWDWSPIAQPNWFPPYVVIVGPLLQSEFAPLSGDLLDWMTDAQNKGEKVILVAFGSVAILSDHKALILRTALSHIASSTQSRVLVVDPLYSSPTTATPDVDLSSDMVRFLSHAPQQAVLQHPATALFVSHCGMQSLTESLAEAVPMYCIPFFGDQPANSRRLQRLGAAQWADKQTFTESQVIQDIQTLLTDQSYRQQAQYLAQIIRLSNGVNLDRAAAMLETAARVGIEHLVPAGDYYPWYARTNFDVVLFVLAAVAAVLSGMVYGVYRAVRCCCCKSALKKSKTS